MGVAAAPARDGALLGTVANDADGAGEVADTLVGGLRGGAAGGRVVAGGVGSRRNNGSSSTRGANNPAQPALLPDELDGADG